MALALIAGMIVGFIFFDQAWRVIERAVLPGAASNGHSGAARLGVDQLIVNGSLDAFFLRVKVAFIVGVILSSPVWLYQLWAFIAPGLYAREKRWALRLPRHRRPAVRCSATCWPTSSLGQGLHFLLGLTPGRGRDR